MKKTICFFNRAPYSGVSVFRTSQRSGGTSRPRKVCVQFLPVWRKNPGVRESFS